MSFSVVNLGGSGGLSTGEAGTMISVATTSTQFGVAMLADSFVCLKSGPDRIYRITSDALSTDTLSTASTESVGLEIVGEATTVANLETAYPAANHDTQYGWVIGPTAANGLFQSDGSVWVKQLDSSGNRSDLPDFAGGIAYGVTNKMTGSGTASYRNSTNTSDETPVAGTATGVFDGNGGSYLQGIANTLVYKLLDTPSNPLGKFTIETSFNTVNTNLRAFEVFGISSGGTITELTLLSVTTSGAKGTSITNGTGTNTQANISSDLTSNESVTVTTSNTTQYDGYGIRIVTAGALYFLIDEFYGYETNDNTDSIDCVGTIKKIHTGYGQIGPTALTADTLLDDTYGTVLLDPSGADFTMTLPAVATVLTGKKYTFKLVTAPATTAVILAGDGSETIDGATTNATALTAQWDTVTIQSDGTQWLIV